MGKLRTINHPGIETQEVDISGSTEQVGGCTTLVMGFFPQGESGKPVHPTTNSAVKSYFGTPETEAERYAYYACKTVFDNGGNLVAARIPYNNNSQYLTPAVKYNIEEWSTKHIKKYRASDSATKIINTRTAVYESEKLDDSTQPLKSSFYYRENSGIGIYTQNIFTSSTDSGTTKFGSVTAISSTDYTGSLNTYYELTYNPFTVTYTNEVEDWTVSATVTEFEENTRGLSGTAENWDELVSNTDVDIDKIVKVSSEVSFSKEDGKYLNGEFAAGSYYKYINPNIENGFDNITEETTNWAEGLDFFPIVAVTSNEIELPYDTYESPEYFPRRATVEFSNDKLGIKTAWPEHDVYTKNNDDEYTIVEKETTSPDPDTIYYKTVIRYEEITDIGDEWPDYDVYTKNGDVYTIVEDKSNPPDPDTTYYKETIDYTVDTDMYVWPENDVYTYDPDPDDPDENNYTKVDKNQSEPDPTNSYYRAGYFFENSLGDEKSEITETTVFKSIESFSSHPAFGNYRVTIGEITKESDTFIADLSYNYTDDTNVGYYVYDKTETDTSDFVPVAKWRRFWDYVSKPTDQWINTNYNKYSSFRVEVVDSKNKFDTNFFVNDESQTWTSEEGPYTITASRETGTLTFSGDPERGEFSITPIFHDTKLIPGMDCSFFTRDNSKYFNIEKKSFVTWKSNLSNIRGTFYTESVLSGEDKKSFYFDPTVSSPVTAFVDSYGPNGIEKVMAIKSYYESGEGTQYPEFSTTDYLELRLWDANKIHTLEDLKTDNSEFFDVIHREYTGELKSDASKISRNDFKVVPLSTDVTNGYYPEGSEINSTSLALTSTDTIFDENNYPVIMDANPFGTGWMKVLKSIQPGHTEAYHETDFFQFVSPYTSIEEVVTKHSEKYQWIHWKTFDASKENQLYVLEKNGSSVKIVNPYDSDDSVGGAFNSEEDARRYAEFNNISLGSNNGVLLSKMIGCSINDVPAQLSEIENVVAVVPDQEFNGFIPLEEYQDYRDEAKTPKTNSIVIANITEQKFGSDMYNNAVTTNSDSASSDYSDEVLGIVPVLMGGFQALPRQSRIELPNGITNSRLFDAVQSLVRGKSIENDPAPVADHVDIKTVTLNPDGYARQLGTDATTKYDAYGSTYSNQLLSTVPAIDLNANYKPNGAKMNYLTLAVCQLSLSKVNDNKIAVTVLETFTGSLDRNAKDERGNSLFIDNVVNNEDTGSTYVKLFSNYQTLLTGSQTITDEKREIVAPASNDTKVTLAVPASLGSKLWWTKNKPSMSLGFTNEQTKKYISYATMVATIENVFDSLSNVDEIDIDLVMDAGLSTIANRVKKYCDQHPEETKMIYDVFYDKISSVEDVAGWKSMCAKLTTFCQTTRKDCITLLDAPRNLCVKDNVKLVSPGSKYSVDYDILPKFNYLGGMNSSYAAGYCDWMLAVDDFTSKNVWIPPSIAAEGAVIYTDYNSNYWMAPAGQTRGNVMWAVDLAFNPNAQQQDSIYSKGWNYAISSSGSIMVWGQKTMLNSTSSFNRINIRRLFCRLERMTRKNSKWVIFEINNERTRNVLKDRLDPIYANVKAMGGIFDYQLICDSRNNPSNVVQNNEIRFAALIKPEHAAEYVILTFFNMNQDVDFSETYSQL